MTLALAYVSNGNLRDEFHESVIALLGSGLVTQRIAQRSGPNLPRARTIAAQVFMEGQCDHLLFVDTDTVFEVSDIVALIQARKPIVTPLMVGMDEDGDHRFYVGHMWDEPWHSLRRIELEELYDDEDTELVPVAASGTGCMLIERRVLEATGVSTYHPFGHILLPSGQGGGEDVGFCLRASEVGFSTFIHTGVRVGHIKEVRVG